MLGQDVWSTLIVASILVAVFVSAVFLVAVVVASVRQTDPADGGASDID